MNLTIKFINRTDMPDFYHNWNLKPFFKEDQKFEYSVRQSQKLNFTIQAVDLDGDEFGIEVDLRMAAFFGEYELDFGFTDFVTFFFYPDEDTPIKSYQIYVRLYNVTDDSTFT